MDGAVTPASVPLPTDETTFEAGIKVQIHSQEEPSFIDQLGFGVAPGFQTFVSCQEQRVGTLLLFVKLYFNKVIILQYAVSTTCVTVVVLNTYAIVVVAYVCCVCVCVCVRACVYSG